MFRFENEWYLYALFLIPFLIALFILSMRWRTKAMESFGELSLVHRLIPDFSKRRHKAKFILFLLALGAITIALANPQVGTKLETVKRRGIDIIIALDVSKSMLAEDISPSRLERAKQMVSKFISTMKDDRVGIIIFAGNAYLQMPLTSDYAAAKLFMKTISPDIVPTQGTAIGEAIELAIESYDEEHKKHKALVLISDGENHEEGATEMAERAVSEGISIYTLGIGSEKGGNIPKYVNGIKRGYKKDKNGKTVISKLNPTTLKEVADIANGKFIHIQGAKNELSTVLEELGNIEKRDFEDRVFTDYADQFQYFVALALLLLVSNFFLSERRRGRFSRWNLFGE